MVREWKTLQEDPDVSEEEEEVSGDEYINNKKPVKDIYLTNRNNNNNNNNNNNEKRISTTTTTAEDEPIDHKNLVYYAFIICSAGFLMPYNTFVTATDYFQSRYPSGDVAFYFTAVYMYTTFPSVFLAVRLLHKFTLSQRIYFSYIAFLIALAVIPLAELGMSKEIISEGLGYGLTIIAVGIVGIGGGVQQSSYYGLAAQLPPRYTQAIMAGESVAGLLACFNRIVTKAASGDTVDGLRTSTYAFFILSMFILIICMFVYSYIRKLPYTQYYLNHNNQVNQNNQNSLSLNGSDYRDREKNNENENENEKEKDALRRNEQQEYEIPMQTLHSDENGGENDNSLLENGEDSIQSTNSLSSNGFFQSILVSIWPKDRADTLKRIWKAALTTFLTFFVTLAIFPGVDTVPKFDSIGDWFPVLIITTFNFFDFIGKIVSAYHFNLTLNKQLLFATLRLIFVPLLILCATPRGNPFLSSLAWPIIFNVFFGFSNGYIGSCAMIVGPMLVPKGEAEMAGNIMTLSLLWGLTVGVTVSLGFNEII